jgi:hypothetical protein
MAIHNQLDVRRFNIAKSILKKWNHS